MCSRAQRERRLIVSMSRRSLASIRLWLVATLFGLSALLAAGGMQGPADAVHGNRAQAFAAGTPSVEPFAPVHLRRVAPSRLVHALPRTSASASLFRAASAVPPIFAHSLALHEHVAALTVASLSTGPSRAPPAA